MAKDKRIIRVGDRVRIEKPDFFVRCGYELCLQSEIKELWQQHGEKLREFFRHFNMGQFNPFEGRPNPRQVDKIVAEIAYSNLLRKLRDGAERKIFTDSMPEYAGDIMPVREIKFVKTGKYNVGWGSDEDYAPASLSNEKTHKLLRVRFGLYHQGEKAHEWIEAANVVKLDVDTNEPIEQEDVQYVLFQ